VDTDKTRGLHNNTPAINEETRPNPVLPPPAAEHAQGNGTSHAPAAKARPLPATEPEPAVPQPAPAAPVAEETEPQEAPAEEEAPSEVEAPVQPRDRRLWATLAVGVLIAGVGIALGWSASGLATRGEPAAARRPGSQPGPISLPQPAATPAATPDSRAEGVTIQQDKGAYHIHAAAYDAVVAADGYLTDLRVGGADFLDQTGPLPRAGYFVQESGERLKMSSLERVSENVLEARSLLAAIRYEFTANRLNWALTNTSSGPMPFCIVLNPEIRVAANVHGELARVPVQQEWWTTTWFRDRSRLTITGEGILGPWREARQVWMAMLRPHEERQVMLRPGVITDAEASRIAAAASSQPALVEDLSVFSPVDYQVFQRRTRREGAIVLRGRAHSACDHLEARVSGPSIAGMVSGAWQTVALMADRTFAVELPTAAGGWYQLELRALHGKDEVARARVDHVGVGEVFVLAGAALASNTSQDRLRPKTGLVSTFSGVEWRVANDPQPGVHDFSEGGSCWPAFGDALVEKYHVPIGLASTGHAGALLDRWQPQGELFGWLQTRLRRLGPQGFRAVLWHQNEQDLAMLNEDYSQRLMQLIQASRKELGWDAPWMVAVVSYRNSFGQPFPISRKGQQKLWEQRIALEGPDLDALAPEAAGAASHGMHLQAKGLRQLGQHWADKVGAYLDQVLGPEEKKAPAAASNPSP
jgi:hypothetical protein